MPPLLPSLITQPELEERFRLDGLPRDLRLASRLLVISVVFQFAKVPADLGLLSGPALSAVLSLRVAGVLAALAALARIRGTASVRNFDFTVTAWMLLVVGEVLVASALLPVDYTPTRRGASAQAAPAVSTQG